LVDSARPNYQASTSETAAHLPLKRKMDSARRKAASAFPKFAANGSFLLLPVTAKSRQPTASLARLTVSNQSFSDAHPRRFGHLLWPHWRQPVRVAPS